MTLAKPGQRSDGHRPAVRRERLPEADAGGFLAGAPFGFRHAGGVDVGGESTQRAGGGLRNLAFALIISSVDPCPDR